MKSFCILIALTSHIALAGLEAARYVDEMCGMAPLSPLALANAATPSVRSAHRIVQLGDPVEYGHWPSLVLITNGTTGICTGVLVRPDLVLTAGHCLYGMLGHDNNRTRKRVVLDSSVGSQLKVVVGKIHLTSRDMHEVWHNVAAVQFGAYFNERNLSTAEPDFGRIWLRVPAIMNDYVQPACIPAADSELDSLSRTDKCWFVGFGIVYQKDTGVDYKFPEVAQQVKLKRANCSFEYPFNPIGCFISTDSKPSSICPGDSGGPLLCVDQHKRLSVVGVAKTGRNCDGTGTPRKMFSRLTLLPNIWPILMRNFRADFDVWDGKKYSKGEEQKWSRSILN